MPLIQWFLYWTRYSWNWTVQWNPIYISINLILPLACWLDFADSCAICCYKTSQIASNNDLNNVLRLRTASPRERRCFEASAYSEGGLGSDQRIELRISTETPLDIPPPPPNYIQKVRNKLAHGSVFGQIWVVGKISRSCCKGVDCAGFENLLCASKTAKFGGWLKMYIIIGKYPNKVECDSSLSKVYLTFNDWPSMW